MICMIFNIFYCLKLKKFFLKILKEIFYLIFLVKFISKFNKSFSSKKIVFKFSFLRVLFKLLKVLKVLIYNFCNKHAILCAHINKIIIEFIYTMIKFHIFLVDFFKNLNLCVKSKSKKLFFISLISKDSNEN